MQDFSYHTHNNTQGIGDGKNSCEEMITRAEEIGFSEIGVSNHLIYNPNLPLIHPHDFNDFAKALDYAKKNIDEIRETASRHKIKVYAGFEVDYYPSAEWHKAFENIIKETKPDYLIGSTHNAMSKDEKHLINLWNISTPLDVQMKEYLANYWQNTIDCINSGYFTFIAHCDIATNLGLCKGAEWSEWLAKVAEALRSQKIPFEINTKGIHRCGRPCPDWPMIKDLIAAGVPTLISDDAHSVDMLGAYFADVEAELAKIPNVKRFKF